MEFSNEIKDLAAALAKAQAEMGNAKRGNLNPHFKYKYADLAEVLDTCREVLGKYGLSVVQPVGVMNEMTLEVHTMLMHESGQWIKSTMQIPMKALDPQAAGSSITYARRYALSAMVGIAQGDDDAEGAMGRVPKQDKKPLKKEKVDEVEKLDNALKNGKVAAYASDGHHSMQVVKDGETELVIHTHGTKKVATSRVEIKGSEVMLLGNGGWSNMKDIPTSALEKLLDKEDFKEAHEAIKCELDVRNLRGDVK